MFGGVILLMTTTVQFLMLNGFLMLGRSSMPRALLCDGPLLLREADGGIKLWDAKTAV